MTNLIETLTTETESFRVEYISQVTVWAKNDFTRIEKAANAPYPAYEDFATPGFVKGTGFNAIDYAQGKNYQKALDTLYNAKNIVEKGLEAYVAKMVKLAGIHYSDSIVKLAGRIKAKGLNEETLTVKAAHVDVNLEITLTDGTKTVRAFTIIASGPIQRPHYRYLIK